MSVVLNDMRLFRYAVMRLCSYAVMRLCSYAVMQLCRHALMPSCLNAFCYIQFFLKKYAKANADPKIAIMVTNPAVDRTAIPDNAAPLVHPLASWPP